jgi:peptidoglycan/LPS O-acetylase OafA/YrhL
MPHRHCSSSWHKISFGDILHNNNNIGPGFDTLRIVLAIAILYSHSFGIASGSGGMFDIMQRAAAEHSVAQPTSLAVQTNAAWYTLRQLRLLLVLGHTDTHFTDIFVPMFFALSGFLVTGSAFRTKAVRTFLTFRILRIVPALFTEVSLSSLVLGPLLTVFSMKDYFSDPKFIDYFGNIIGRIRFELPGLFLNNPLPAIVNGNLRTLPAEFYCYLIIAAMIATGALFHRTLFTIVFAVVTLPILLFGSAIGVEESATNDPVTVYYFFCGALFYHWREKIPFHWAFIALSSVPLYVHYLSKSPVLFFPLILTYVTIYLGLSALPTLNFIRRGDYSYGIYLYGFPITQALVTIGPQLRGHGFILFLVTTPITFAFAMLSWHLVERPTLRLKRIVAPSSVAKVA